MRSPARQSNMELLRCIAMFLVLVVHSDFAALKLPTHKELLSAPFDTSWRIGIEAIALVCVNLFVLISGYFGIKFKWKSIVNLLFQVLFWGVIPFLFVTLTGLRPWDWSDFGISVWIGKYYWFPQVYIVLMVLSPILNSYIDKAKPEQFRRIVLILFAFTAILGGTETWNIAFQRGYGLALFIFLYLFGRYARINRLADVCDKSMWAVTFVLFTVITALAMLSTVAFIPDDNLVKSLLSIVTSYTWAPTIIASMALLLLFARFEFQSKILNYVAASSFAVYLIQVNPVVFNSYFNEPIRYMWREFPLWQSALMIFAFLVGVFFACVLLDQMRILVWRGMCRLINFHDCR